MKKTLTTLSIAAFTMVLATASFAADTPKRIMIYGDSNAFGWAKDTQGTVYRLPADVRWPEKMAGMLGKKYEVVVEALGGRTTNIDCGPKSGPGIVPGAGMDGAAYLPAALASHMPLDMVVIWLGSNDLMVQHNRKALDIAAGIAQLTSIVTNAGWQQRTAYKAPKVMIVCPSKIDAKKGKNKERFAGAKESVEELQKILPGLAKAAHGYYFDVNTVVPYAQGPDELHYTPENHAAIAKAMTREIQKVLK